ncbi:tetratricopeptide repeat protein [Pigmentiphaga aceris]|uniref:Tetratricopeptide repeat protein n=1 Tax=Pigmentiphaga aceris TaxID=1940612 RepID=A0A5C0B308_9BURK|nr:tetratricopeptide repeat protein [Pigmentiphaga aceris]QEI08266.1 tetratricopeptide repeat protein [Pigmentiphaga aceris]
MSQAAANLRSEYGQKLYDGLDALPSSKRLTSEQLEVIYSLAYAHVVQQQYAQALPIFTFLAQYGPTRKHYLTGLALSLRKVGRFDEAINMYSLVLVLFPDSLEAALHIAECQIGQNELGQARISLSQLVEATEDDPDLQTRARSLLELLSRGAA